MGRRLFRSLTAAACFAATLPLLASADEPPDALSDYAILTPAVEGQFTVVSGLDYTGFIPPYLSFGNLGDRAKTKVLRSLIEREGYDPAPPLTEQLRQALIKAGFTAVHEPVPRRAAGRIQSLAWSDVPKAPGGRVMLDVSIRWLCFCSDVVFTKFYPGIALSWRLLGPAQQLIEPSRQLVFLHYPAFYKRTKTADGKPPPDPATLPPEIPVSESCGYDSMKPAEDDPKALLRCVDEMLRVAAERLIFDLKAVAARRPREALGR